MQNKAQWLQTTLNGYKVRVQFLAVNELEAKRCSALLMNPDVQIVGVTTQGPLTADLMFTSKGAPVDDAPLEVVTDAAPAQKQGIMAKVKSLIQ